MRYFDAHNHLHDSQLQPHRAAINRALAELPVAGMVINGTRESDWAAAEACAREGRGWRLALGLHPWYVNEASAHWLEQLKERLEANTGTSLGEIGLDRWMQNYDLPAQRAAFRAQLVLAAELERPVTVHCLKAWGTLLEELQQGPALPRGFLLHSYGGSAEMSVPLAKLGAYFSFSPYFLHTKKAATRQIFAALPLERLLAETDAPAMAPPTELNRHPLPALDGGVAPNHPANIELSYLALSELRGLPLLEMAGVLEQNFRRFFGDPEES